MTASVEQVPIGRPLVTRTAARATAAPAVAALASGRVRFASRRAADLQVAGQRRMRPHAAPAPAGRATCANVLGADAAGRRTADHQFGRASRARRAARRPGRPPSNHGRRPGHQHDDQVGLLQHPVGRRGPGGGADRRRSTRPPVDLRPARHRRTAARISRCPPTAGAQHGDPTAARPRPRAEPGVARRAAAGRTAPPTRPIGCPRDPRFRASRPARRPTDRSRPAPRPPARSAAAQASAAGEAPRHLPRRRLPAPRRMAVARTTGQGVRQQRRSARRRRRPCNGPIDPSRRHCSHSSESRLGRLRPRPRRSTGQRGADRAADQVGIESARRARERQQCAGIRLPVCVTSTPAAAATRSRSSSIEVVVGDDQRSVVHVLSPCASRRPSRNPQRARPTGAARPVHRGSESRTWEQITGMCASRDRVAQRGRNRRRTTADPKVASSGRPQSVARRGTADGE